LPALQALLLLYQIVGDIFIHLNLQFREKFESGKNDPYFCSFLQNNFQQEQEISLKII
jgi:hypothetical protein